MRGGKAWAQRTAGVKGGPREGRRGRWLSRGRSLSREVRPEEAGRGPRRCSRLAREREGVREQGLLDVSLSNRPHPISQAILTSDGHGLLLPNPAGRQRAHASRAATCDGDPAAVALDLSPARLPHFLPQLPTSDVDLERPQVLPHALLERRLGDQPIVSREDDPALLEREGEERGGKVCSVVD